MGIVSGFIKTKRYRKQSDNSYVLQSEWTSSDTTEMPDGTTLTDKMESVETSISTLQTNTSSSKLATSHTHAASKVTAGTFGGNVVAPASTAYTTNHLRNMVFTITDPGANVSTTYANGSVICVYE